jgi:hypothetical protein
MFKRRPFGREVSADLTSEEADLLRRLVAEFVELLEGPADPSDAARDRLFPKASDDEEVARQFDDLAASDLDAMKKNNARIALQSLSDRGPWHASISDEEREAWLVLLTDLRLVIGARQGVNEETMERMPDPDDPDQWPLAVLHYLGALQESLVRAVS